MLNNYIAWHRLEHVPNGELLNTEASSSPGFQSGSATNPIEHEGGGRKREGGTWSIDPKTRNNAVSIRRSEGKEIRAGSRLREILGSS